MVAESQSRPNIVGVRIRSRREELGLSQEKIGVQIGIDESSSRARISRYELGTHEPPVATARLIAKALAVPLAYLYCDEDDVAVLLKELATKPASQQRAFAAQWLQDLRESEPPM